MFAAGGETLQRGLKPAAYDMLWVAGPKILAGGLQFLLTVTLLRRMDPAHFGMVSVCLSGVLLCDSVVGGATDSGVLRLASTQREHESLRSLLFQKAGLLMKLGVMACLLLALLPFSSRISLLLFQTRRGVVPLILSAAALLGMLTLRSVQMHFQVNQRFAAYGVADLTNSLLKFGGIALLLVVAKPQVSSILALFALAPICIAVRLLLTNARPLLEISASRKSVGELFTHVRWYLVTSTTGTLLARMDVFLVSSLAGVGSAGIYAAAQAIALVPQLIGSYVAVVFSPRIMPMLEAGTLRKLYRDFQLGIGIVACLLFAVSAAVLPRLAVLVLPASFQRSVEATLILLPSGLCALVNFPLTILLLLFTRPKFLVALDCVMLPLLFLAYRLLIPVYGVIGAAWITTIAALVKTVLMQVSAWRLLQQRHCRKETVTLFLPLEEDSHAVG